MSKTLYDATIMQLKGRALEAYGTLEMLFKNPAAVPDHTAWVDEIIKHTRVLAENENAMITLQQYFGNRFNPPAPEQAPQPAPVPIESSPPGPAGPRREEE
tara:strand:+ start:784 stop:1086 length:303 start_codon:yes stop_codon:yes gene_type:complete